MAKNHTIFQNLDKAFSGNWGSSSQPHINSYDMSNVDKGILYRTKSKEDYENKKLELQQSKYLKDRWVKANVDLSVSAFAGLNNVKLMYRDCDLMDGFPEISAALDIVSEESCLAGDTQIYLTHNQTITVKELYDKKYKDFFCYTIDNDSKIKVAKIEKVIYKGEQELYELTLDDDTVIKCTGNHKWMKDDYSWIETKDMNKGIYLASVLSKPHKVISVKALGIKDAVYDLFNSDVNHSFTVKCKNGMIVSHNCIPNSKGNIINVYSSSERIKSIIDDLFINRLNIQITAPMIIRAMCKYGNQFMLLDVDNKLGVKDWKQLPVFNVERIENGIVNPYSSMAANNAGDGDLSTKFVWVDETNSQVPFRNWQIAHFRLLTNSLYLPYGCLVGDTRIETEYGYKEIKDIKIGDKVWTFNVDTQKRELSTVTMWMNKGEKDTIKVFTNHNYIEGTPDHKVLVYEDKKLTYKEIKDISIGDLLVVRNGVKKTKEAIKIDKVKKIEASKKQTTYDITVDSKNSNFFANGIVTHNCSYLNGARRHWRILSLMEDMMLIYRLERSIERRVYKIYVGAIDDADVQAYVENIANQFKRTPIIDPMTGQLDLRKNILPVHKDTPIPLLDGRTITIEQLSKEFNEGKENYVYSIQDKTLKIVPGKVVWCGKNYTAEKLIRITLDDGSHFDLAAEHEIIMRDGTKKRADEVSVGESVMPFYRKVDKNSKKLFDRYEKVFNPNSGKYEFTHRIIAETVEKGNDLYNTVHHRDFNKYNNSPCNLMWMDYHEHHKMHDEIRKVAAAKSWEGNGRTNRVQKMNIHFDDFIWDSLRDNILHKKIVNRKTMLEYINDNLIDHLIEINSNKRLENNHFISREVLENRIRERGFCTITEYVKSMLKNHKIAKIETIEGDDVYCMTVVGQNGEEDRHNFAIRSLKSDGSLNDSGCFVSNCVDQDLFIPTRSENAPNPVDTLPSAQNLTAIDDIKFIQNKVCTALRIPKTFLNFEETNGDGKNLALEDIRFTRTVNRIQQAFLMELTKVASIHLYLLGFTDDLTNFSITMNNPSTQAEQLEIDNLQKKISACRDAISDPGNGIPVYSQTRALKEIMKMSDKEIKDNLEEIRLEKALSAELEKTSQIIKRTGVFDIVDRMYGEPDAQYQDDAQQQGGDMGGLGAGGGMPSMGGGDFGSGLEDLGAPGSDEAGDIPGAEGAEPTTDMGGGNEAEGAPTDNMPPPPSNEGVNNGKPLLTEQMKHKYRNMLKESKEKTDAIFEQYLKHLDKEHTNKRNETSVEKADVYDKSLLINEEFNKMIDGLDKKINSD